MFGQQLCRLLVGGVLLLSKGAYAGLPSPTAPEAQGAVVNPALVSSAPTSDPPEDHTRLVAGLVLGSGLAAIAAGTTIAIAHPHTYAFNRPGGRGEPDLVGLGIACVGVPLAMVGTMLWFNLPRTTMQVSAGPSGLDLSGRF